MLGTVELAEACYVTGEKLTIDGSYIMPGALPGHWKE